MPKRSSEDIAAAQARIDKRMKKAMAFVTGGTSGATARKAAKITGSKLFKKQDTRNELKINNVTVNSANSASGFTTNLISMSQGTTVSSRLGQQILVKSINCDVTFNYSTTNLGTAGSYPTNSTAVRGALVYDKQPNGAQASYSDIYTASGASNTPYFSRNIGTLDRYDVLAEFRDVCTVGAGNSVRWHKYLKCSLPVRYNGNNNGNVTDIATGNLLFVAADENSSGAQQGNVYGVVSIRFEDD